MIRLQRKQIRLQRFGAGADSKTVTTTSGLTADDKLAARARRFGFPVPEKTSTTTSVNGNSSESVSVNDDQQERLRKRAERFGLATSASAEVVSESAETSSVVDDVSVCVFVRSILFVPFSHAHRPTSSDDCPHD